MIKALKVVGILFALILIPIVVILLIPPFPMQKVKQLHQGMTEEKSRGYSANRAVQMATFGTIIPGVQRSKL